MKLFVILLLKLLCGTLPLSVFAYVSLPFVKWKSGQRHHTINASSLVLVLTLDSSQGLNGLKRKVESKDEAQKIDSQLRSNASCRRPLCTGQVPGTLCAQLQRQEFVLKQAKATAFSHTALRSKSWPSVILRADQTSC